jgi:hypothetical protein
MEAAWYSHRSSSPFLRTSVCTLNGLYGTVWNKGEFRQGRDSSMGRRGGWLECENTTNSLTFLSMIACLCVSASVSGSERTMFVYCLSLKMIKKENMEI